MKFSVTCNNCNRKFVAQSEQYGRLRYRCPYCSHNVMVELRKPLPVVEAKPLQGGKNTARTGKPHGKRMMEKGKATLNYTSKSIRWTSNKIATFHSKYDDADLWIFFSFSLLFVLAVIGGLYLFAWCAKLIVAGNSWLFKIYLDIVHSF